MRNTSTGSSGNPYNDLPTIRLLDGCGAALGHVSQREAARLLRADQAELVLEVPPAVRLSIATADYLSPSAGPAQAQESADKSKGQFLSARRGALYGNFTFQGPDGQTMFHGDGEKALWYLNRGLVEVVTRTPPVLRFKFTPGGRGHAGDAFYLAGKVNRCVVCGAVEGLNRHHIVPSVYRRHLPRAVKEHSHHDVVLLCVACYEKYEREADLLKAELGRECGVPLHGLRGEQDWHQRQALKFARALLRDGEKIPPDRKEEMRQVIAEWAGKPCLGDAEVEAVARLTTTPDGELIEHGRQVVAQTTDVQGFVRRWREHFLRAMQPRCLPEYWDVERPVCREDAEDVGSGPCRPASRRTSPG
jgi:hypothetical protein